MSDPAPLPSRRRFLLGLPLALLPALPAAAAGKAEPSAGITTTDLSLACDTALAHPMRRAAAAFRARAGVQVHVFPTAPALLLPQLQRQIQNDILVTGLDRMEEARRLGLLAPGVSTGPWRAPLVLAALRETTEAQARAGRLAVPDPTPGRADGRPILAGMGLDPARAMGAIDTREVAFLLRSGAASAGLLHLSELRGEPKLRAIATVPAGLAPPLSSAAAVTTLARRPKPEAFIAFLATPEATALLAEAGMEAGA